MKNLRDRFVLAMTSVITTFMPGPAAASDWPSKPVTIVVAFAPGGATDLVGRLLATALGASFHQPFIVSNRAGAAGQIGTEYVANQSADGYTLLISSTGHVIAPALQSKLNYHPVTSFEPIALLTTMPNLLVVNPGVPAKTFSQFLQWGRAQSNIPYGSAGTGGANHLSGELLRHVSKLPLSHVSYKGNGPSMLDAISGHIPALFVDTVSVSSFLEQGKLRALAVTSGKRSRLYPELPTIAESGYKDYDIENWMGLYAPAGTPEEIVTRLNREVIRIMNSPEMLERMLKLGADSNHKLSAPEFRQYVEDQSAQWIKTIQATGVQVSN